MKNKGFTLIELLAVIIILAIIAIIAVPIILHMISNVQLSSYRVSLSGIEKAIEIYQVDKEDTTTFILENGRLVNEKGDTLVFDGNLGESSGVKITKSGNIYSYIYKNGYCTLKRGNNNEIEQFKTDKELCNMDVATNLVKNGYGEYKDNTNFSDFAYEDGTFKRTSSSRLNLNSDEYIKIDTNKKYYESVTIKTNNSEISQISGIAEYDIDKKHINSENIYSITNTLTYLTNDLKDGDTIIYLNDISNFAELKTGLTDGLIFWNYVDSTGYEYPELTYSRNVWRNLFTEENVDKSTNTITLLSPWNHGIFEKGTKVGQSYDSFTSSYGVFNYERIDKGTWILRENYITGTNGYKTPSDNLDKFRNATEYVKWLAVHNYNALPDVTTYYKDIIIREVD